MFFFFLFFPNVLCHCFATFLVCILTVVVWARCQSEVWLASKATQSSTGLAGDFAGRKHGCWKAHAIEMTSHCLECDTGTWTVMWSLGTQRWFWIQLFYVANTPYLWQLALRQTQRSVRCARPRGSPMRSTIWSSGCLRGWGFWQNQKPIQNIPKPKWRQEKLDLQVELYHSCLSFAAGLAQTWRLRMDWSV